MFYLFVCFLSITTGRSVFISVKVGGFGFWINGGSCFLLWRVCFFVPCKIQLELMKATKAFKNLVTTTALLETVVEDDSENMILTSYGIICPFTTVRLLQTDWWDQCRNMSILKNHLFSHTGNLLFFWRADVIFFFF